MSLPTKPIPASATTAYEQDFYAWTQEQALKLRTRRLKELDVENIAEELESMGRSERQTLISRLTVLLAHLLKWRFQPQRRGKSWRASIKEQRLKLAEHLDDNPSLRAILDEAVIKAYRYGVLDVVKQTPFDETDLPDTCPFTLEQIFDENYWPD